MLWWLQGPHCSLPGLNPAPPARPAAQVWGLAARGCCDAGRLVLALEDFLDILCIVIYCQHRARSLLVAEGSGLMRPLSMRAFALNGVPVKLPPLHTELIPSRSAASSFPNSTDAEAGSPVALITTTSQSSSTGVEPLEATCLDAGDAGSLSLSSVSYFPSYSACVSDSLSPHCPL
jgi:hypothetical protein